MASLKDLRNKIKSVKSIQQVTNAMKMVAVAKLRKSQENMENARPYTNSIEGMIHHLIPDIDRSLLPILESREIKKKLFLVSTVLNVHVMARPILVDLFFSDGDFF